MLPMSVSDGLGRAPRWPDLRAFADHAERGGLDSLWVCDHYLSTPDGRPSEGIHEGWTLVAALAAATDRVELGQLVMCTAFRPPALLAKMAATADLVSGGRLTLGLGAGWDDEEYGRFGHPTDRRVARFAEAVHVIVALLAGEAVTHDGFHPLRAGVLLPAPERRIPVLVAAGGPRMLRLTARYADAWNTAWYGVPDDRLAERIRRLDRALAAAGRDPSTLRRTVGLSVRDPAATVHNGDPEDFTGTVDELAALLDTYARLGFDDAIVGLEPRTRGSLDRLLDAVRLRLG